MIQQGPPKNDELIEFFMNTKGVLGTQMEILLGNANGRKGQRRAKTGGGGTNGEAEVENRRVKIAKLASQAEMSLQPQSQRLADTTKRDVRLIPGAKLEL